MKLFATYPAGKPNSPALAAATANDARALGFQDVETHYLPATHEHTVTGNLPATTAQHTVDRARRH